MTDVFRVRYAARVVLVDERDRVLLMEGGDPTRPELGTWWITPGGGVEGSESAEQAARRELREETGLAVEKLVGPVGERTSRFEFAGERIEQRERYFGARVAGFVPSAAGWTELERRAMVRHRWWTLDEIASTDEIVYPETLAGMVREVAALLPAGS